MTFNDKMKQDKDLRSTTTASRIQATMKKQ